MFEVQPLKDAFGAEIVGLDLSRPLDRPTTKALIQTFHENQVLVIRDQSLEFEDFDRVSRYFGDQKPHFLDHLRMGGHPAILMLSNVVENGKRARVH